MFFNASSYSDSTKHVHRDRRHNRLGKQWRGASTRSVVGIDWTGSALAVAQMTNHGGKQGLTKRFYAEWPDSFSPLSKPEVAGAWLRDQMDRHHIDPHPVIVSLPRRDTALRLIEVPAAKGAELDALVRMQVQARSSISLDDLYLDYLPQSTKTKNGTLHVLTVTVPRSTMNIVKAVMQAANLNVKMYGVGELALGALDAESTNHDASLAILANRKKLEFVLMRCGVPVASHSEPMREAGEETTRAIVALVRRLQKGLPDSLGFARIDHVTILGPNAKQLQASATRAIGIPAKVVATPCLDSARVFALYQSIGNEPVRLDFLHSRETSRDVDDGRPFRQRMLLGAVVSLAAFACLGAYHRQLDLNIRSLSNSRQRLNREIQVLSEQVADLPTVQAWATATDWATVWGSFVDKFPDSKMAYLTQLELIRDRRNVATLSASGASKEVKPVLDFNRRLHDKFRVEPTRITTSTDPLYPNSFQVTARQRRSSSATPTATTEGHHD